MLSRARVVPILLAAVTAACGSHASAPAATTSAATSTTAAPTPSPPAPADTAHVLATAYQHLLDSDPIGSAALGLHAYDGKLPDHSPAALAADIAQLRADRAALTALPALAGTPRDERDMLLAEIRNRMFTAIDLDAFHTNPMAYAEAINLDAYIVRDYAPLVQRAAAVITLCHALPAYLAQARANLAAPMPRPWLDTALLEFRGLIDLADHDVRTELTGRVDLPLANQADIGPALDGCKAALAEHVAWLEHQLPTATDKFALGAPLFLRMLSETQGIELDLPTLQRVADADLARNTAAIETAAHAIDAKHPVAVTVLAAANDRPGADEVLAVATDDATTLRQYILAHKLVSIPTDDPIGVRPSPPFERWNAAFLDSPGPFETKRLPSYYYISPPDPSWPAAEQKAYVPPRADLVFTTAHEVYPGHFVHALHIHQNPSKILQSFGTYSTSEGWAHYAEEMMYDAGAAGTAPQARIGMLKEALLRNVRFVVAIGEHTAGMSVADATQLFATRGFVDAGNARQQAVRGTFDPMYVSYTLGKLIIRKLRDDWMARHPGATLGAFHDELLSHASLPLPLIRRDMLGDDAGPPL